MEEIDFFETLIKDKINKTPVEVLQKAEKDDLFRKKLACFFSRSMMCEPAVVAEYLKNNLKEYLKFSPLVPRGD